MVRSTTCGKDRTNYPNGQWPSSALCPLYTAPDQNLRRAAALAFDAMSSAYQSQTGSALCVTEGYRSLADQIAIKAATPIWQPPPERANTSSVWRLTFAEASRASLTQPTCG
jgi:D-alanyl-D-alanine carboxypeptidase